MRRPEERVGVLVFGEVEVENERAADRMNVAFRFRSFLLSPLNCPHLTPLPVAPSQPQQQQQRRRCRSRPSPPLTRTTIRLFSPVHRIEDSAAARRASASEPSSSGPRLRPGCEGAPAEQGGHRRECCCWWWCRRRGRRAAAARLFFGIIVAFAAVLLRLIDTPPRAAERCDDARALIAAGERMKEEERVGEVFLFFLFISIALVRRK